MTIIHVAYQGFGWMATYFSPGISANTRNWHTCTCTGAGAYSVVCSIL